MSRQNDKSAHRNVHAHMSPKNLPHRTPFKNPHCVIFEDCLGALCIVVFRLVQFHDLFENISEMMYFYGKLYAHLCSLTP